MPEFAPPPTIVHNEPRQRYEAWAAEELLGFASYRRPAEGVVVFDHTEVAPAHEGRGVASRLAARALAESRDASLRVVPACHFFAVYIRRHPEFADLVEAQADL